MNGVCSFLINDICVGVVFINAWAHNEVTLRWHWTVVSKSLSNGYHGKFNHCLLLISTITLSSQFASFFDVLSHLYSYKTMLLNDWSTPIIITCCWRRSYCNNPLIITHLCSNESISRILSITLVDTRDLVNCAVWAILPYFWK